MCCCLEYLAISFGKSGCMRPVGWVVIFTEVIGLAAFSRSSCAQLLVFYAAQMAAAIEVMTLVVGVVVSCRSPPTLGFNYHHQTTLLLERVLDFCSFSVDQPN